MFRIRNEDGLYSDGGNWVNWSSIGKVWRHKRDLSNHFVQSAQRGAYSGRETIVEYKLVEVGTELLSDYRTALDQRSAAREAQLNRRYAKDRQAHLKEKLAHINRQLRAW